MTLFFAPVLAAALLSQFQGGAFDGTIVDEHGKPVGDIEVVFYVSAPWGNRLGPVDVRTKTDADGRFRLTTPSLRGDDIRRAYFWAHRSGSAIAATSPSRLNPALVWRKPEPRTIKIEGPAGEAVAGALVSPRVVFFASGSVSAEVPDSLAAQRTVTTGPDGTATFNYLAGGDRLSAVRVTAESIGTQDFPLTGEARRVGQGAAITIRLKATSRLAGRVRNRAGEPVAGQTVEVWFDRRARLEANPVGFKNGPLRTAADGSFQTPDNLLVGSSYRVVIRAPGMEPILSDWITIGDKPRILLPMIQRPLRTLSGRALDRQGRPLAGIEVFQSGDGPERTATTTDADGRFSLGGFRQGTVFLFARGEGFRFFGRMVKPGDRDVTVEVTRISERPTREMRMLADAIPADESRALARRLIEPYWEVLDNNIGATSAAPRLLARVDPETALRKLEEKEFASPELKLLAQAQMALNLAWTDPAGAEKAARAIAEPGRQAVVLVALADALPEGERDRKLALLDGAALQAQAATDLLVRVNQIARVAERWYELGEKERAKTLFGLGLRLANQVPDKTNPVRGRFAARLARVDLPSALAIANEFPAGGDFSSTWVRWNIAVGLAADDPAEAERVLRGIRQTTERVSVPPEMALKMAMVDPARSRRLTDESQRYYDHPQTYLFLALGLKSRDMAAAHQAFQTAMQRIDPSLNEEPDYSSRLGFNGLLLPMVEQIDPALVPEFFWRAVATRPLTGNPRSVRDFPVSHLVALLGWYDRDVAAALFEPVRAQMELSDDLALARMGTEFLAWSILDPRAAVARLEQMPVDPKLGLTANRGSVDVAGILVLPHEARWRKIWGDFTEMRDLFESDFR
jgi:hypothetical protein